MRAQVTSSRIAAVTERIVAVTVAAVVAVYLLRLFNIPGVDRFTGFALLLGASVWAPLVAKRWWRGVGELTLTDTHLVVQTRFLRRHIPLSSIRGARAIAGRKGASVLLSVERNGIVSISVDRPTDAEQLARDIRAEINGGEDVLVPVARWTDQLHLLRAGASSAALAYYLHVVRHLIGGDKALFGITALGLGFMLLVMHFVRHQPAVAIGSAVVTDVSAHPQQMHEHIHAHAAQRPLAEHVSALTARLAGEEEPLGRWVARLRKRLRSQDRYRIGDGSLRDQLEDAVNDARLPFAERALALRIVTDRKDDEARRRIDTLEDPLAEEAAWLEEVALAKDDSTAVRQAMRREPRFEP